MPGGYSTRWRAGGSAGCDRSACLVRGVGQHADVLAALIHDPSIDTDSEIVRGPAATALMLVENSRLVRELQASCSRVVKTAERERRRLERDLHDGAQVLSHYDEPAYAVRLLDGGSGGRACLLKERVQEIDELTRASRDVANGGSVVDSLLVERLLAAEQRRLGHRLDALAPRVQEILALGAEGWSNGAIADRLVITKHAIERHIHSIFWNFDLGDPDMSGRVKAALPYLARQDG